jgi:hypothetical protein
MSVAKNILFGIICPEEHSFQNIPSLLPIRNCVSGGESPTSATKTSKSGGAMAILKIGAARAEGGIIKWPDTVCVFVKNKSHKNFFAFT